jgi:thiol-disulfide isomerase/thioredoxin
MKICLLGDTHFGVRNDSKAFHAYYEKFYSQVFIPYLLEHKIDTVIQLGDLFDRRKYINFNSRPSSVLPIGEEGGFFSKMQSAGASLNNTTIMIIVALIFFAVLAGFYYYYYVAPEMNVKYKPNRERVSGDAEGNSSDKEGNSAELLFFFADWCPHCKTAKPIWDDLKTGYENKKINGYRVVFTEVNCSEESAEVEKMMNKYNVEGYPTIKLLKDGQIIEYDAKPSKETLSQFLNTVL